MKGGPICVWNTSSSDKEYKSINIFGACVFSNREKNTYIYYICLIDFLHIKCISTERITSKTVPQHLFFYKDRIEYSVGLRNGHISLLRLMYSTHFYTLPKSYREWVIEILSNRELLMTLYESKQSVITLTTNSKYTKEFIEKSINELNKRIEELIREPNLD